MEIYTGCSGWSYSAWKGPFYPDNLENRHWLPYYSQVFNYVEIDTTFYQIPSKFMVQNWAKRTPPNFRFTAKFPKIITHDKKFKNVENELNHFYEAMLPLKDKLLTLLIQFPPYLHIMEGLEALRNYDFFFDGDFRYAVEVRHPSWFNELAYNYFKNNEICLAWNQLDKIKTPPIVTSDFVYLRLIGDRSISENDFGGIQKDRTQEMQGWSDELKNVHQYEKSVKIAIVSANNHYAGFGPGTVNQFRSLMDMPEIALHERKDFMPVEINDSDYNTIGKMIPNKSRQTSIADFFISDT